MLFHWCFQILLYPWSSFSWCSFETWHSGMFLFWTQKSLYYIPERKIDWCELWKYQSNHYTPPPSTRLCDLLRFSFEHLSHPILSLSPKILHIQLLLQPGRVGYRTLERLSLGLLTALKLICFSWRERIIFSSLYALTSVTACIVPT